MRGETKSRMGESLLRFAGLLVEVVREIFDENAYERFLALHSIKSSPSAYAHYLRETNASRERRPRCC